MFGLGFSQFFSLNSFKYQIDPFGMYALYYLFYFISSLLCIIYRLAIGWNVYLLNFYTVCYCNIIKAGCR